MSLPKIKQKFVQLSALIVLMFATVTQAQLLSDYNGDGVINITAFGDSITYGVGDGGSGFGDTAPFPAGPAGYPPKLSQLLGVPVHNLGSSGEKLTEGGFERWPSAIQSSASDIILLLEGTNDVTVQTSQLEFRRNMQQMINVAIAANKLPILLTLPPTCCNIAERRPPTRSYSDIIKERANINGIPYVDITNVWDNSCPNSGSCDLYVQPEGLHPNSKGYTAMAQAISAKLLDIDIFASDGASKLEGALGLAEGSVIIVPDAEPMVLP